MNSIRTKKLGSICDVLAGGTPSRSKPTYWGGDVPWVKISDMLQGHIRSTDETISEEGLSNSAARILPKGTLLLSIFATIGRTAQLEIEAATNQAIVGLIPKRSDEVDVGYLRRHLEAQVSSLVRQGRGGAQSNINGKILKDLDIPLPPLDEQKRIAAVLDKADALRRQRQESLQLTEKLLQSVFIDMFGDPIENPKKFHRRKLGDFFVSPREGAKCGPFGSSLKKSDFQATGVPVWGIDNISADARFIPTPINRISAEKFVELKNYSVCVGDIIISRAGTVGRMCVVEGEAITGIIGSNLIRLRLNPKALSPYYFMSLMRYCKDRLGRLRAGPDGAFSHMGTGVLENLEFPYPTPALQQRYLEVMASVKLTTGPSDESADQLSKLFSSLQQRAFRGELDLNRLVLDPSSDTPVDIAPVTPVPKPTKPKAASLFLQTPAALEPELKKLDRTVRKGDPIPWSADYFLYRILGTHPAPFSFGDIMQKAEAIFEEPPPYETIRELIFDLLGQDGKPALLRQRFDLQTNLETSDVIGRKEIVFEPVP